MLATSKLGKSYGGRVLFEDVSLQLNRGSRYGLVGANGAGKSTFLRILCSDEEASEGHVMIAANTRMSVLRQDRFLDDASLVIDLTMAGDTVVWGAMQEKAALEEGHGDASQVVALEERIAMHDGYTLRARATAILEGLGLPIATHERPLGELSGGFKLRVLLAQVLLGGPDLLMLDEPTNHLDILSIRWLERFLAGYTGCAIVISHDRRFLDATATHILDVDYGTVTIYTGNYTAFVANKQAIRERKEAEVARAEAKIAEKRAFVDRFGAKATKAKQAQSRLKQIEKIEVEELAATNRRTPHFRFEAERPSGRDVLTAEKLAKAYGEKKVLTNVGLTIRRGEKVAIIGPNGLGKSTLLKVLVGETPSDEGTVAWGHETRIGYFAQDHKDLLPDPKATPLDVVWNDIPQAATTYVRGQLGRVLFSGEDVTKPVGALSGGEAARLVFCRIMVKRPNVLVLDEPTNHLDMEAIDALTDALKAFDGTVIFVSHDRAFVASVATRIFELTPTGPRDFPGTYDEYLSRQGEDHLDGDRVVLKAKEAAKAESKGESAALSWEEQKKLRNRKRDLPVKRDKVLAAMEVAEARRKAIADGYAAEGFFEKTPADVLAALEKEDKDLAAQVDAFVAEWERLEAEIEALGP